MIGAIIFGIMMGFAVPALAEPDFNLPFTAQKEYEEMRITWLPVDDIRQACQVAYYKKRVPDNVVACAQRSGIVCTIYTQRNLDLAILGHEIRHCYEGGWHD
jgi:hypothetical protein